MSPANCAELISQPDIDGFLVGGALVSIGTKWAKTAKIRQIWNNRKNRKIEQIGEIRK